MAGQRSLPSSFELEGWAGQLERLRRWHQRVVELRFRHGDHLGPAELDVVHAFFQSAYHLRHWMENDHAASRAELDALMADNQPLRIARDLCNGSKHLVVRKPSVAANVSFAREYVPGPVGEPEAAGSRIVVVADGTHDLWKLIDSCVSIWESFAAARIPTRRRPGAGRLVV